MKHKTLRIFLSGFICLNLLTVMYMNRPTLLIEMGDAVLDHHFSPQAAYVFRYGSWLVQKYAHLVGLDNRWQMFGRQSRFNWWFVIRAKYANQTLQVLPLPLQSNRTFLQTIVFDFKEPKFHLNIYTPEQPKIAYAYYLCRHYPMHQDTPIESIVFELHWQNQYSRKEAEKAGRALHPEIYKKILHEFKCPPKNTHT